MKVRQLQSALNKTGEFTFEGRTFKWVQSKTKTDKLMFPSGLSTVTIETGWNTGFIRSVVVDIEVDGHYFGRFSDTSKIKEPKLRAAVELGLRAWEAQLAITARKVEDDRADALKRL